MMQFMKSAKASMKGFKTSAKSYFKSPKSSTTDPDHDVIKTCLMQAMVLVEGKFEKYLEEYHEELIAQKVKENKKNKIDQPPNVPRPTGISIDFLEARLKSKRWKRWSGGSALSSTEMGQFMKRAQGATDANADSLIQFDEFFHMLFLFDAEHCQDYDGPGHGSPHSLWFSRSSEIIAMNFVLMRQLADAALETEPASDPTKGNISREVVMANLQKLDFIIPKSNVPDLLQLADFLKLHYTVLCQQPETQLKGNPSCLLPDVGSMAVADHRSSRVGIATMHAFKYLLLNFQSFDADASGNCDWLEIARGIKGAQTYQTLGRLQMTFQEVDVNNSKALDYYEFMQMCFLLCCQDGRTFDKNTFDSKLLRKTIVPSLREAEDIASCFKQLRIIFDQSSQSVQHGGIVQGYMDWPKVKEFSQQNLDTPQVSHEMPLDQRVLMAFDRCRQTLGKAVEGVTWMGFLRLVHKILSGTPATKPPSPAMPGSPDQSTVASIQSMRFQAAAKPVAFGHSQSCLPLPANINVQQTRPKFKKQTQNAKEQTRYWVGSYDDIEIDVIQHVAITGIQAREQTKLWSGLIHPNCSYLFGTIEEGAGVLFLMERCEFGTLFDVLHRRTGGDKLDRVTRHNIATGIARGGQKVHELGWIHNNLKSTTVMISAHGPKLCGFENACLQTPPPSVVSRGDDSESERYMAPEMLLAVQGQAGQYDKSVDLFSYGVLLWELYHCKIPYYDLEMSSSLDEAVISGKRPTVSASCDRNIRELFENCWGIAGGRPTFQHVLERLASAYRLLISEEMTVCAASPKQMEQLARFIEPAVNVNMVEDQVRWSIENSLASDPALAALLSGIVCFDSSTGKLAEQDISVVVLREAMRILRSVVPVQGSDLSSFAGNLSSVSSSGFVDSTEGVDSNLSSNIFGQDQFYSLPSMPESTMDDAMLQSHKLIKWKTSRSDSDNLHLVSRYLSSGIGSASDISDALNGLSLRHGGLRQLLDEWDLPEEILADVEGQRRLKSCFSHLHSSMNIRSMFLAEDAELPKKLKAEQTHCLLIGPSGAGKSTFANRLLDQLLAKDQSGKISILSSESRFRIAHRVPGTQSIKRAELEDNIHVWDTPPILGNDNQESSLANSVRLKRLLEKLCKLRVNLVLTIVVDAFSITESRGRVASEIVQALKVLCGDWLRTHHDRVCFIISKSSDERDGQRLTKSLQLICKDQGLQVPSSEIFVYDPLEDHDSFRRRDFLAKLCNPDRSPFAEDETTEFQMPLQENSRAFLVNLVGQRCQRLIETLQAEQPDWDCLKWDLVDLEILVERKSNDGSLTLKHAIEDVLSVWQSTFCDFTISAETLAHLCKVHGKWSELAAALKSVFEVSSELNDTQRHDLKQIQGLVEQNLEYVWNTTIENLQAKFLGLLESLVSQMKVTFASKEEKAMTFCQQPDQGCLELLDNLSYAQASSELRVLFSATVQDANNVASREITAWRTNCLEVTRNSLSGLKQELCNRLGISKLRQLQSLLISALIAKSNPSDVGSGDDEDGLLMSEVEFLLGELKKTPPQEPQLLTVLESACQDFKDLNKKATMEFLGSNQASAAAQELQVLIDNDSYFNTENHQSVKGYLADLKQNNQALYYALRTNLVQHKVKVVLGDFNLQNLIRDGKLEHVHNTINRHTELQLALQDFEVDLNIDSVKELAATKVRSQYIVPALEEIECESTSCEYLKVSSVMRLASVKSSLSLFEPEWERQIQTAVNCVLEKQGERLSAMMINDSNNPEQVGLSLASFMLKGYFLCKNLVTVDHFNKNCVDGILGSGENVPSIHAASQLEATLALYNGIVHRDGELKASIAEVLNEFSLLPRAVNRMISAWREGDDQMAIKGLFRLAKLDCTNAEFLEKLGAFKIAIEDAAHNMKYDCRKFDVNKASAEELSAMFGFLEKLERTLALESIFKDKNVDLSLTDPDGSAVTCKHGFMNTLHENFSSSMLDLDRTFNVMRDRDAREFATQTKDCRDSSPWDVLQSLTAAAAKLGIETGFIQVVSKFFDTLVVNVSDSWLKFLEHSQQKWDKQIRDNLLRFSLDCSASYAEKQLKKSRSDFLALPQEQQSSFVLSMRDEVEEMISRLDQDTDSRGIQLNEELQNLLKLMDGAANLHKVNQIADQAREKLNDLKTKIRERKSYSQDLETMKESLKALSESPKYKDIFEVLVDSLVEEVFQGLNQNEIQGLIREKKFGAIFSRYRQLQEFSKAMTLAFGDLLSTAQVQGSWVESRKSRLNVEELERNIRDALFTSVLQPARQDISRDFLDSNYLDCTAVENFVQDNKQLEEASKVAEGSLKESAKWQDELRQEAKQSFSKQITALNQKIVGREEMEVGDLQEQANNIALLLVKGVTIFLKLDFARSFEDIVKEKLFNSSPQGAGWSARVVNKLKMSVGSRLKEFSDSSDDRKNSASHEVFGLFRDIFESFNIQAFNKKAGGINFEDAIGGGNFHREVENALGHRDQLLIQTWVKYKQVYEDEVKKICNNSYQPSTARIEQLSSELRPVRDRLNQRCEDCGEMLGLIASLWTYLTSPGVSGADYDGQAQDPGALRMPHATQILGILCLLGVDHSEVVNQLVQIKTGEGKSIALGFTAAMLACLGFNVDVVCYSSALSQRDESAFAPLFEKLNKQGKIHYRDFYSLVAGVMEDNSSEHFPKIQQYYNSLLKTGGQVPQTALNKKDRVILLDEVDVFFSESYYGQLYQRSFKIENSYDLLRHIWRHPDQVDLATLMQQNFVKSIMQSNPGLTKSMLEHEMRQAIYVREHYKDSPQPEHQVNEQEGTIVYIDPVSGGPAPSISYGYYTTFLYLEKFSDERFKASPELRNRVCLQPLCGGLLYSKVPQLYAIRLGMTGTLSNLTKQQEELLGQFEIKRKTFLPSTYKKKMLNEGQEFGDTATRVVPKAGLYKEIANEIKRIVCTPTPRAILVIMEDNPALLDFGKWLLDQDVVKGLPQAERITDGLSPNELQSRIFRATRRSAVTLVTRSYGRGTDFVCRDPRLADNGGVHMLMTFYPEEESEEVQIKGRTCRQDDPGSARKILTKEDLISWGLPPHENGASGWDNILDRLRKDKLAKRYNTMRETESKNTKMHEKTIQAVGLVHQALVGRQKSQWERAADKFLEISRHNSVQSRPVHNVLALDRSGSMRGRNWDNLKIAVGAYIRIRLASGGQDDVVSVILFNHEAERVWGPAPISRAAELNKILAKEPSSQTNFADAVVKSKAVLKITDQAQYKPIAVFMCDGAVYQNSKPPIVQKLCKDLVNAEGPSGGVDNLQSFFMYLGKPGSQESKDMQHLANCAHGTFLPADDPEQLKSQFQQVATGLAVAHV